VLISGLVAPEGLPYNGLRAKVRGWDAEAKRYDLVMEVSVS